MSADLGAVRIHTDATAGRAAREFGAHAFTVGSHIAFADGQYLPDTGPGRRLLAHELVHTVQQRTSGYQIQRATDYDITGIQADAASFPTIIFFDRASFNIIASEQAKIPPLAVPASRNLTLTGFTSEEGAPAGNLAIINSRIARVSSALGAAGHTAARTANPQPTASAGQIEYRRMRAVEVVPTPVAGPVPTSQPQCQVTAANPHPEVEPCGASFSSAHPVATAMVTRALTEVSGPTAAATAVATPLFPGIAMSTLKTGLTSLQAQLVVMAGRFQCHNTCDAGCNRPGFNSGSGATAMMTVCPGFIGSGNANENAVLLIHEGLHATPGVVAQDIAYRLSRMIQHISGAQATTNTDSWVLLVLRLNPGVVVGGPPSDAAVGMNPAETAQAREALSFAESWMLTAEFDTSLLYEGIKGNVGRAGGWNPSDNWTGGLQHVIGWIFGLTDPGAVPPYATPPTSDDQFKVAGIYDRYHRMRAALWTHPISLSQTAAPDAWAPNLGSSVTVTAPFFAMTPMDRVLHLVTLMATSMPDIPAARRRNYADAANQIRWHRGGIGP